MDSINKEDIFVTDDSIYGKGVKPIPKPEKNIGIDTSNELIDTTIEAAVKSSVDMSTLSSFTQIAQSRDQVYQMLDNMGDDSTIAAALSTYAEYVTEYNDSGVIVWADSSDPSILKNVDFILQTMRVDKNIYKWVYSLCKYGDVYLKLYRESEVKDGIFDDKKIKQLNESQTKNKIDEAIKLNVYSQNDHYTGYVEMCPNPAEMFELSKFGKTYGYIKADVASMSKENSLINSYYRYSFNKDDINVFGATDFVHAALEDDSSRVPEEVSITSNTDSNKKYTYTVKRGQSLLYNIFKIWRELTLLQNSILLNRLTKSSIVRIINVQVGDMAKEAVKPHLMNIKSLIEQKSALSVNNSLQEYTNPGPVENNIYLPVRGEQGAITVSQIGGDVDVKGLADLDYFNNLLFGALRIPKAYFGFTDDGAGFNGGQSLAIISSGFAKLVKRIQNTILQCLTDAVNLILLDRNLDNAVNRFELHMVSPTTQEEIDRRDNMASKVQIVSDIMNITSEIEDKAAKLKILKSLLSNTVVDTEVIQVIQDEIDKLEAEKKESDEDISTDIDISDESDEDNPIGLTPRSSSSANNEPIDISSSQDITIDEPAENSSSEDNLPSPSDLGIDFADNDIE